MGVLEQLCARFTWSLAWRDSRRSRGWLLLLVLAPALGVGALVAVGSFGGAVRDAVEGQARTILGADLRLQSREPLDDESERRVDRLLQGAGVVEQADVVSFVSMALLEKGGSTALVTVRAVDGPFPFYGELETTPPAAAAAFRAEGGALVDAGLLLRFGAVPGDSIRIGGREHRIAGAIDKIPGESATESLFGPRVFLRRGDVDPALLDRGSRVTWRRYVRLADPAAAAGVAQRIEDAFGEDAPNGSDLRVSTVENTRESFGRTAGNLDAYLGLVAFIALVLGALGAGSAMHVYLSSKVDGAATLRCLGLRADRVFAVYLAQVLMIGVAAAFFGVVFGAVVGRYLPRVFADLLPVDVQPAVDPRSIAAGVGIGLLAAVGFSLLPLLPLRRVAPLRALRAAFSDSAESGDRADRAPWLVALALLCGLVACASLFAGSVVRALVFSGCVAAGFVLLMLAARGLAWALRRFVPDDMSWAWRQGLKNLHRPQNQTAPLLVALGLGAFLLLTLAQIRVSLLREVRLAGGEGQPNLLFFDVQDDQAEALAARLGEDGAPVMQSAPIVTMRIVSVKGQDVLDLQDEPGRRRGRWALRREYRSTYRDRLEDSEELIAGSFVGEWHEDEGPVPISLEEEIAERLDVGLGDPLVFDVQGVRIPVVVASVRRVDWRRMRPNFFAVFPRGVLESAPKFHVLTARAEDAAALAALQRDVVERFPNVSSIDLTTILAIADELLARVGAAVRFMALFSVAAGVLVLISAVLASRRQRVEESVLLRTLGAPRAGILRILAAEYLVLGLAAAFIGAGFALAAGWALCAFLFAIPFVADAAAIGVTLVALPLLTLGVGLLNRRVILDAPPLAVLREV